jgi:hypothetical protein
VSRIEPETSGPLDHTRGQYHETDSEDSRVSSRGLSSGHPKHEARIRRNLAPTLTNIWQQNTALPGNDQTNKKKKNNDNNNNNFVAFRPQANYTDWATAIGRRILVPTFGDRRMSRGQRGGNPTVVNFSFVDRSRYFFFQVAPHLWSWGWVDPVRDPPLLGKLVAAGIVPGAFGSNQELWPLDHRSGPRRRSLVPLPLCSCRYTRYRQLLKCLHLGSSCNV